MMLPTTVKSKSATRWVGVHGQEGNVAPIWEQEYEEVAVLAFQAYLNNQPWHDKIAMGGLLISVLQDEVLRFLRV